MSTHRYIWVSLALLATAALGCAPANVAGTYTVDLTDEMNGCNISGWTTGTSSSGVTFVVTQNGSAVTGEVTGVGGAVLDAWLGSSTFTGSVSGSGIDLTLTGTHSMSQGACAYTYNAHIVGTLQGDALSGSITYSADTNSSPDCGSLTMCQSVQNYSGTRPPM